MSPVPNPDRWRIVGGVLLALLIAYLLLVHWWFTAPMLSMGAEIQDMRDRELTAIKEVEQGPRLAAMQNQLRAFEAGNPGFLPEANRELASAGLVQRLQQVVAGANANPNACRITAQTPTDMPSQEPFARVMVQVRLNCGMGELGPILHALESGSPQLFIDNLDVLSRRSYLQTGEAAAGLDVSFDLYGYLKSSPGVTRG